MTENRDYLFNKFKEVGENGVMEIDLIKLKIFTEKEMLEMALVENIQREELNPVEVALSYKRLMEECKLTQDKMSERVGKKRSTISNYIRLLKLPAEILAGLRDQTISMGHARALINMNDQESQINLFRDVVSKGFYIKFLCNAGSVYSRQVAFGEVEDEDEDDDLYEENIDEFNQNFDTEQLSRVIKLSGLSSTMQVFPKDGLPLLFKSNVGNLGKLSVYIKSKNQIEEESLQENI